MKHELILAGVRASWGVIRIGQRITLWADKWEATVRVPFSLNHRCALRLLSLGGRVEALGVALEGRADRAAQRRGCDMDFLMSQLVDAHTSARR